MHVYIYMYICMYNMILYTNHPISDPSYELRCIPQSAVAVSPPRGPTDQINIRILRWHIVWYIQSYSILL